MTPSSLVLLKTWSCSYLLPGLVSELRFARANLPISLCDLAKVIFLVDEFCDLLKMGESSSISTFNSKPFISDLWAGLLQLIRLLQWNMLIGCALRVIDVSLPGGESLYRKSSRCRPCITCSHCHMPWVKPLHLASALSCQSFSCYFKTEAEKSNS